MLLLLNTSVEVQNTGRCRIRLLSCCMCMYVQDTSNLISHTAATYFGLTLTIRTAPGFSYDSQTAC